MQNEPNYILNKFRRPGVYKPRNIDNIIRDSREDYEFDPSVEEWIGLSIQNDWLTPKINDGLKKSIGHIDPAYKPDLNFSINDEQLSEFRNGIPSDYWEQAYDAQSYEHLKLLKQNILDRLDAEQKLNSIGMAAIPARLLSSLVDPATLGLTIATGGIYRGISGAKQISRMYKMMALGSIGAAEGAAYTGIHAYTDPLLDGDDVLFSAGIGAMIGGGLGAISLNKSKIKNRKVVEDDPFEDVDHTPAIIKDKNENFQDDLFTEQGEFPFEKAQKVRDESPLFTQQAETPPTTVLSKDVNKLTKPQLITAIETFNKDFPEFAITISNTKKAILQRKLRAGITKVNKRDAKLGVNRAEEIAKSQRIQEGFKDDLFEDFPTPEKVDEFIDTTQDIVEETVERLKPQDVEADVIVDAFSAAPVQWGSTLKIGENQIRIRPGLRSIMTWAGQKNPLIRFLGRYGLREAAADVDARTGNYVAGVTSASERIEAAHRGKIGKLKTLQEEQAMIQRKADGSSWWEFQSGKTEKNLTSAASKAIRSGQVDALPEGTVKKIAQSYQKFFADMLKYAKKTTVAGFAEIPENFKYLPRIWQQRKIDEFVAKYGQAKLNELLEGSLKIPGLNDNQKAAVVRGLLRKIRSGDQGFNNRSLNLISDDIDDLSSAMTDLVGDADLASEIMEIIETNFAKRNKNLGKLSRAKFRTPLDEGFTVKGTDADGKSKLLTVNDLLEDDLFQLASRYSRLIHGAGEMNGILKKASEISGVEFKTFNQLRNVIQKTEGDLKNVMGLEYDMLELFRREIMGLPKTPHSNALIGNHGLSILRDIQYWRLGGSMGRASIPEFAYPLFSKTTTAFRQQMPQFNKMIKGLQNGTISNENLREFYYMLGASVDRQVMQFSGKIDPDELAKSGLRATISRMVSDVSLLNYITRNQQEIMARVSLQSVVNDLIGTTGRNISDIQYAQLGLSTKLQNRIKNLLNDPNSGIKIVEVPGLGKVIDAGSLNVAFNKADDNEAVIKLLDFVQKDVEKSIQRTYSSDTPTILSSEFGKLMGQFRNYQITAYNVQLIPQIQRLRHGDFSVFREWTGLYFLAASNYALWSYINTIGQPEKRKEYLAWDEIAKGGFTQMGASTFIPGIIDTALGYSFGIRPFAYGRTTGLASDFLTGNPTVSMIDSLGRAVEGTAKSITREDTQFSKGLLNNYFKNMFLQSHPLIKPFTNYAIEHVDLPEKSKGN